MEDKSLKDRGVKIIAFVGMAGSGKSVAVDYMTNKGIPKVYFGGMILKAMEKQGIEITPENEKKFREEIREKEGKDWVVRQVIDAVYDLVEAGQRRIILDGLYTWTEYGILKHEFPGVLTVVAVVTAKKIRYERVGKREIRPLSLEEIRERDRAEIENLEKGGPIAAADYFVTNDGDIDDLHEQIDKVLKEVEF